MRCPIESENPELLLDYCSRTLSSAQSMLLEAHLEHCPACREFRDAQTAVWNALDSWQDVSVSDDFDERLYARIEAVERLPWWRRWAFAARPYFVRPAIPMAAAAGLLVAGGLLLNGPGNPPIKVPVAGNGQVQVEQVERALEDIEMLKDLDLLDEDNGGSQTL
jgi:hypothetical protein